MLSVVRFANTLVDQDDTAVRLRCGIAVKCPSEVHHEVCALQLRYLPKSLSASKRAWQAMRLFVGEPVWTPLNRPAEDLPSRRKYLDSFKAAKYVSAS